MQTPTIEPTIIRAGQYYTWQKTLADYSAPDWTLKYTISGSAGGSLAAKSATGSGTTHTFVLTAAETAALSKGIFKLFGWVENGSTKIPISTTTLQVLANLFTAVTADQRTDNQIILDAIIAVIKGRATKAHVEIAIAGRNIMLLSPAELYKWQKFYEYEVQKELDAEQVANGGTRPRNLIQFVSTT